MDSDSNRPSGWQVNRHLSGCRNWGQGAVPTLLNKMKRWGRKGCQKDEISEEEERPERSLGEGQEAGTRTLDEDAKADEDAL